MTNLKWVFAVMRVTALTSMYVVRNCYFLNEKASEQRTVTTAGV